MNRLELHILNLNQNIVLPLTPHRSVSALSSSSTLASHKYTLPKKWYICNNFFLILVIVLELILLFSCYFSVVHVLFSTYTLTLHTVERAWTQDCALYLEWTKGKLEAICHAFLLQFILLLWKVNLPPTGFLLWEAPLHCRNEAINDAFHTGISYSFTAICKSPMAIWKLFFQSPQVWKSLRGLSGMVSGRTQISPSQELRKQVASGQCQLQDTFIQKVQIHPLSRSGFRSLGTPDKALPGTPTSSGFKRMNFQTGELKSVSANFPE